MAGLDQLQAFESSKTEFADTDVNTVVNALKTEKGARSGVGEKLGSKFDNSVETTQKVALKAATEKERITK